MVPASTFLSRHWRIVTVAALGAILAFIGSYLIDPTYSSSTRVLIRGRDATFLSSTGQDLSAQPGVVDSSLAQSLAATYAGIATSRGVATAVVEDLDLDARTERSGFIAGLARGLAWVYRCTKAMLIAGFCAPVDPYEEAVASVQEGTTVAPLGTNAGPTAGTTGSYVLEVTGSGHSPEEARDVTDGVADELVRLSSERFAADSADNIASLETLVLEAQDDVALRGADLATFQTQNGLIAADGTQLLSATTYETVRSDLIGAQAQEADVRAQLDSVSAALATTPRRVSTSQSINTGRSATDVSADAINPVYSELEVQQATLEAELTGQTARVAQLQTILAGATPLADNAVQAEQGALESSLLLADQNLATLTRTLQAARVTAAQGPVDLTRLDEAAAPTYPSEPKRYMYLALGLLIGTLAGAALTARARRGTPVDPSGEEIDPDEDAGDLELLERLTREPQLAAVGEPATNGRAGAHLNGHRPVQRSASGDGGRSEMSHDDS